MSATKNKALTTHKKLLKLKIANKIAKIRPCHQLARKHMEEKQCAIIVKKDFTKLELK